MPRTLLVAYAGGDPVRSRSFPLSVLTGEPSSIAFRRAFAATEQQKTTLESKAADTVVRARSYS
jgi:hypothetical protein